MTTTDRDELTARIKACAREVGFTSVGVAQAEPFAEDGAVLQERIAAGHYGGLPWFSAERAAFSSDPHNLLPSARSIVSLAVSYRPGGTPPTGEPGAPRGRISAYAWGRDYHTVLKERMERVVTFMRSLCPTEGETRTLVDTARILDRAAARRAGVGWVGKHTNVITKEAGSWVFLGEILTGLDLTPDVPLRTHCGRCDLCMRICPTGAIVAPYTVDSDRCISYLTIEHRGIIPRALRPAIGNWIFGCDLCQEVCPPNRRPGTAADAAFAPVTTESSEAAHDRGAPELIPLLTITPQEFSVRFGHTPVKRARREGLQRNVAIALGNSGDQAAVGPLIAVLASGAALVRAHAAWALGRLGGDQARTALQCAATVEDDPAVREEIAAALTETHAMPSVSPSNATHEHDNAR